MTRPDPPWLTRLALDEHARRERENESSRRFDPIKTPGFDRVRVEVGGSVLTERRGWIAAVFAVSLVSCGGARDARFPTRSTPAGYPPTRAEHLPGNFAVIPASEIALALVGREYRVRYGVLQLPDPDQPVDAFTGAYGFQAEGPFERDIRVSPGDIYVSVLPVAPTKRDDPAVHRLVACVDIRPSHLTQTTPGTLIVLDVQPVGDQLAVPLAIDAVTGEPLSIKGSELLDENNSPCDRRLQARMNWDDNLRRLSRRRSR